MEKILIIISTILILVSCNSNEKTAQNKIKEYIQLNANDPKSYEFIDIREIDTIKISDTLLNQIQFDSNMIRRYGVYINERYVISVASKNLYIQESFSRDQDTENQIYIKRIEDTKRKIKSLKLNPNKDEILKIIYTINFRIKNINGGIIKSQASITYNPKNQKWDNIIIKHSGLISE